jgi:hypothetical protein
LSPSYFLPPKKFWILHPKTDVTFCFYLERNIVLHTLQCLLLRHPVSMHALSQAILYIFHHNLRDKVWKIQSKTQFLFSNTVLQQSIQRYCCFLSRCMTKASEPFWSLQKCQFFCREEKRFEEVPAEIFSRFRFDNFLIILDLKSGYSKGSQTQVDGINGSSSNSNFWSIEHLSFRTYGKSMKFELVTVEILAFWNLEFALET